MANITDIKRRIIGLGPASFQEFCDTFLSRKGYGNVHGFGMKAGTGKTTKGNPDTYFRKENGKYVFVAYTMQEQSIYSKLKEDIEKCLDKSKTGIDITDIEEIVCCHTSSNLSVGDDKKLHNLCESKGIVLTIFGIDEIANQVLSNYRSLAKDCLGLSIDTNQILQRDEFIKQCDANGMSAPLDTKFQFRNKEKKELIQALVDNSVVIVTGKAGVGKTRLVLETIKDFSQNYGYKLYCIKNNNLGIYEDLVSATEQPGKYLFFIDDANELADMRQIVSYITKDYLGYEVKVIVTVRDYVKVNVISEVSNYTIPFIIEIEAFSYDEIKGFLEENLDIKNTEYINKIAKIAEGNPRIAYMAGKVSIGKSLDAINNATQIYEAYYKNRVDESVGNDKLLCLTAGILSVINAVMLNDLSVLKAVFDKYSITEEVFKEKVHKLSQLEVVEVQLDQVASLSDQCLANYMLYYVFFKTKMISFSEILEIGYRYFKNGVIRSVNTIFNIFRSDETSNYCSKEILKVWDSLQSTKDEIYYKFVEDFHIFRPEEGFLLAKEMIDEIEDEEFECENVQFNKKQYGANERPLKLLNGYNESEYIGYVVELLIEYCRKSEKTLIAGCEWLKQNYGIDVSSYRYRYYTQKKISESLLNALEKDDPIVFLVGIQWSKYALGFRFENTDMRQERTLVLYHMELTNLKGVKKYRQKSWQILMLLSKKTEYKDEIISFLEEYARNLCGEPDNEIVKDEKPFVEELLDELDCERVCFLKVIERLLRNGEKIGVHYNVKWKDKLSGEVWSLYKLLEDNYALSELNYNDYREYREKQILSFSRTLSKEAMPKIVKQTNAILTDINSTYSINEGLELLIKGLDSNCLAEFMNALLTKDNKIDINPKVVLEPLLRAGKCEKIFAKLNESELPQKDKWIFSFYESLPLEIINAKYLQSFLNYLRNDEDKNIKLSGFRSLRVLDKFLNIEPDIYPIACAIIYEKRHYSRFIVGIYFELLFHHQIYSAEELLNLFGENIDILQDIYFYALSSGHMVDYSGDFLDTFIEIDETWIQKYSEIFWENKREEDYSRNIVLWKKNEYIYYFDYIFNNCPEEKMYGWKIVGKFKNMLSHTAVDKYVKERQKDWINHIVKDNAHSKKISIIFELLCELDDDLRKAGIETFLKYNDDYNVFKNLSLLPNNWSGSDSFIPAYQKQIVFLESLYRFVPGVKFLNHKARIKKEVEWLKELIKKEEVEVIYRHLYM